MLARFGEVETEFGPGPHPAQAWLLRAHGAFAFASLLTLGALLPVHAKRAWRAAKNRRNGVFLLAIIAVQIVTGYLLYYADERWRARAEWLHLGLGLALPALLLAHILTGRRSVARGDDRRS